ncbi:MAG: hypothetical protein ACPGYV_07220 [Phycisphaeraceae bacterium]
MDGQATPHPAIPDPATPDPEAPDPAQPQAGPPPLDLLLEARPKDGPHPGLVFVKTWDHLPWLVVLVGLGLLVGLLAAQLQSGTATLRVEIISSLVILIIAAAFCWHKIGEAKSYTDRFVFSDPDDVVAFARFDEVGLTIGTPKLQQTRYAWVYFSQYAFTKDRLKLVAGGTTIVVSLDRASDEQRAHLRAGLARVFARPRVGPPIRIRDCMACGYDLSHSPGPDCPECGKPLHPLNYPGTRTTDLVKPKADKP